MHCLDHRSVRRRGSLIIEAVISIAMLATAMVALTRLSSSSSELNQMADRRLAATLAGENTLQRLHSIPLDQLPQQAQGVADEVASQCGCEVVATVEPIESPLGAHMKVTVRIGQQIELSLHDWRLAQTASETPRTDGEPTADGEDSSAAEEGDS